MNFVPGSQAREQMGNANGRISFGPECALDFADEFLVQGPCGPHPTLSQLVSACLSENDRVDIYFGVDPTEGKDSAGESSGYTRALFTEGHTRRQRVLWEVGRTTEPMHDNLAVTAFNLYRMVLANFQNLPAPADVPLSSRVTTTTSDSKSAPTISRAFSPSNLLFASGSMFYFVELTTSAPGKKDYLDTPAKLSRPMRAFDALILAALLALATGTPPLVFAVLYTLDGLGEMPQAFERQAYALAPYPELSDEKVAIIG